MFGIPAQTPVKVIAPDAEWYPEHVRDHVTREFRVFDTHELIVDPSGVRPELGPRSAGVGAVWAEAGWHGFRCEKTRWVMLVRTVDLEYDGRPLVPHAIGATVNRPEVGEVAGLVDGPAYHAARRGAEVVDWTTKGLRITRLRLLSDPGHSEWDVSYCHGVLEGRDVNVSLPFSTLPRGPGRMRGTIYEEARAAGVYAKGLGIFDAISTLC